MKRGELWSRVVGDFLWSRVRLAVLHMVVQYIRILYELFHFLVKVISWK